MAKANEPTAGLAILQSISDITADIIANGGIAKDRYNKDQKFHFRGVEDVFRVVSPLMHKHHVVIFPRVVDKVFAIREGKEGKKSYATHLTVDHTFRSTIDGSEVVVTTVGEGSDWSDKATNKAMYGAYKYALILGFAIPTEVDEVEDDEDKGGDSQYISKAQAEELEKLAKDAGLSIETVCKAFRIETLLDLYAEKFTSAKERLSKAKKEPKGDK